MRFFLDHDVDARVKGLLIGRGHDCWTASDANLFAARDDDLTVYADDHDAVMVTHDREFSERRHRNVVGMHVHLRCPEPDAYDLISRHLDQMVEILGASKGNVFIRVSQVGCQAYYDWR